MSREELLQEALHLINKYNVTAYEIEKHTPLTAVGVQKIINGDSKRPLENTLKTIISYIKQNYVDKENSIKQNNIPQGELKPKEYSTSIKVRLVSNKAKAGWSEGYYNEEYLEELPFVMIDADENYKGKYLAFEVEGDSMEPDYLEGDIVICREIQRHLWSSKLHFRDWDFVIVHSTNGIMLKEITAHNIETGDITCHSLNPKYEDFVLNLHQVAHLYNVVEVRQKGRNKRWNRAKDFM
jgi:hypothetical protein